MELLRKAAATRLSAPPAWVTVAVVVLLLLGLGWALLVRRANAELLATRAAESAILQVHVVQPSAQRL